MIVNAIALTLSETLRDAMIDLAPVRCYAARLGAEVAIEGGNRTIACLPRPENERTMLQGGAAKVSDFEWVVLAIGVVFSFFLASVLLYGWPSGLLPDLHVPIVYLDDGMAVRWLVQRAWEGWIFENSRAGFPFGSITYDYPNSDGASFVLLKLFAIASGSAIIAVNLYILLSFPLNFFFSYLVFRRLGLGVALSFSAAALYTFMPFPFMRLYHIHYLYYFTAPIFFYIGMNIYAGTGPFVRRSDIAAIILSVLAIAVLCSFGVYYALFGAIVVGLFAIAALAKPHDVRVLKSLGIFIAGVGLGLALNIGPTFLYQASHGKNPVAGVRTPQESEVYGFKLMQLIYPRPGHRIDALAEANRVYSNTRPLVNENATSSLGLVGTAGMVLAFIFIFARVLGAALDPRLAILSLVTLVLYLFGTIGGLGALFADVVSPSIRGWNRISIYLAFATIAITYLTLHFSILRATTGPSRSTLAVCAAVAVGAVGFFDQTTRACQPCLDANTAADQASRQFIGEIERTLAPRAAVYQIPHMPFPEVPNRFRLGAYDQAVGLLDSRHLRWSYGCIKGRECTQFFEALDREPLETQLAVIRRLGFSGIYLDKRGYEDDGAAAISELQRLLGVDPIERGDGKVAFFPVDRAADPDDMPRKPGKIMRQAGYYVDAKGPRYPGAFEKGIDFRRDGWPVFVKDVSGLSGWEPWGRWSDANVAPSVTIKLRDPLPREFSLILDAQAFGPNVGEDLAIRIGDFRATAQMQATPSEIVVPVRLTQDNVKSIEIVPPYPANPPSGDPRRLGIGLVSLRVVPTNADRSAAE